MTIVVETSPEVLALEGLVLDGLNLHTSGLQLEELDLTPPPKRAEWATGADSDGAALVRDPLFENRTVVAKIRVEQALTMLLALGRVAEISRKLEECEQHPNGLPLVWAPADSSVPPVTFYVLTGRVSELPISPTGDSGYFAKAPVITVEMTCKPFGYGTEVVGAPVSSSLPVLTLTVAGVPGDVPAEGRLIVTDTAGQSRRFVEWGLEQRHYNAATSLLLDSDTMVTTGFSGVQATITDAYDENAFGSNAITSSVYTINSVGVCGTGVLSHVGTFRVKARVRGNDPVEVRLAWQDGDGPFTSNPWTRLHAATNATVWNEVDLGIVSIAPATLGAQQWSGRIEARSTIDGSYSLSVDYLALVPAGEGYGRSVAGAQTGGGVVVARDEYTGAADGAALNGRVAPLGGTWATSGATTDFAFQTGRIARSSISDTGTGRFAVLTSALTDSEGGSQIRVSNRDVVGRFGMLFRYVNASNFLFAGLIGQRVVIGHMIAGVFTEAHSQTVTFQNGTDYGLHGIVYASGSARINFNDPTGALIGFASWFDPAIIGTGGALASGSMGVLDYNPTATANARSYDEFWSHVPAAEQIVLHNNRQFEVRGAGDPVALRQNAAGTGWGRPPTYRGAGFLLPPAGPANRTSRVLVKANRNDLTVSTSAHLTDALQASVSYTPRYLVVGA